MKILIVEDEIGIANFLRDGLTEEGFQVDIATNGRLALDMLTANQFDLVLLDWMLPGISGIEICKSFRKFNSSTPIIFLTAKDTTDDTINGLDAGANDYIKKPFAFTELLARIRVQLREKQSDITECSVRDITINFTSHQVTRGSEAIALTQKEFALFEFLLRHKGKVCTRARIIEHVWDLHFDADTSVIDVYINFLRKKLDSDPSKSIIETIRGIGYIIRED